MSDAIGGYFELELRGGAQYHEKAEKLNTARNCLEYIVLARSAKRIYVPYFTCDVVMDALNRHPLGIVHYHVNERLEPERRYELEDGDFFLYINYFGLKPKAVADLSSIYGNKLIVDNSQAFFSAPLDGIDTFYSARKFFGVADGAYLYTDKKLGVELERDVSYPRMMHLLKRIDTSAEAGYGDFAVNEDLLRDEKLKRMSKLTERILGSIDYGRVKEKRIANYAYLDSLLSGSNEFRFVRADNEVPMIYPYRRGEKPDREKLARERIYSPRFWESMLERGGVSEFEREIVETTIFCPVDQRYDESHLRHVARKVIEL